MKILEIVSILSATHNVVLRLVSACLIDHSNLNDRNIRQIYFSTISARMRSGFWESITSILLTANLNCEGVRISNSDIAMNFVHLCFPEYLSELDFRYLKDFKSIGQILELRNLRKWKGTDFLWYTRLLAGRIRETMERGLWNS